jgi:alkylated DNA repair protein alkB homolog 6
MFSLLLEPCSLLILKDDMYRVYLHGIKETKEDLFDTSLIANHENLSSFKNAIPSTVLNRDTRVSLTIRYVPKVLKINASSLLFNNKRL